MSLTFVSAVTGVDATSQITQTVGVTIANLGDVLFLYLESASGFVGNIASITGVGGTWIRSGVATGPGDVWYNDTYNVSGVQTITVTQSQASAVRFIIAEYSSPYTLGSLVDGIGFAPGSGVNVTISVTSTFTNDTLLLFTGTNSGGTTFTSTSGMTVRTTGNGLSLADINEAVPGHYTMTGSWDANPFGMNNTLIAAKSSTSVAPPSSGDLGPGYDFRFRL